MDYTVMSVEEIISWLLLKIKNNEEITIDMLKEIIDSRSVVDPIASENAITIFYSGGEDKIANMLADTDNSNIRLIRRTDAFKMLAYSDEDVTFEKIIEYAIRYENPEIDIKDRLIEVLYGVSDEGSDASVVGEGFWTQISSRFASETTGNAYSLCANARADRIFARDELKQWLATADDDAKFGKYTKRELMLLDALERFEAIKEWTISDLANTEVYIDSDGYLAGRSFKGTSLEEIVSDAEPKEYVLKISNEEYLEVLRSLDNSDFVNAINSSEVYLDDFGNIIGRSYEGTALEGIIKGVLPTDYTYSIKQVLYKEISNKGNFIEILNSSTTNVSNLVITDKAGKINIIGLEDLFGDFIGTKIENTLDSLWDNICDKFGWFDDDYKSASSVYRYIYDPLVIDLDFDGFELKNVEDGVYFDNNNIGHLEKTQWVLSDDGLLALDLNMDGLINDGSELFGTSTVMPDGTLAKSGFEALSQYDDNNDGVIDEKDNVY